MTNEIKDGGPAFPQPATQDGHACNSKYGVAGGGLSLRDYFAAAALQGMLQSTPAPRYSDHLSRQAYEYADEMLRAREGV